MNEAAAAWHNTVMARQNGLCAVTGDAATDCHHVLQRQVLRRRAQTLGLKPDALHWDARNGIAVTAAVHANHTLYKKRIPRSVLPEGVFEFAAEYDLTYRLEHDYPEEK